MCFRNSSMIVSVTTVCSTRMESLSNTPLLHLVLCALASVLPCCRSNGTWWLFLPALTCIYMMVSMLSMLISITAMRFCPLSKMSSLHSGKSHKHPHWIWHTPEYTCHKIETFHLYCWYKVDNMSRLFPKRCDLP